MSEEAIPEAAPDSEAAPEARVVMMPPPLQWQVGVPPVVGPSKIVMAIFRQGGWGTDLQLSPNDAITMGSTLRKAGKEANGGLVAVRTPLLGANGQPLAVVQGADDDSDDDDEPDEPSRENEATT